VQYERRHDTQHNDTQHNGTQDNDTKHNGHPCRISISDIQHNDTQHKYLKCRDFHIFNLLC